MSTDRPTLDLMRKLSQLLVLVGLGALLGAPVTFDPTNAKTFSNCSASGSVAQSLTAGTLYVMAVFDEEVWVCYAASGSTCGSGGIRVAPGVVMKVMITSDLKSVSCRSAGATGDVEFTPSAS